MLDEFVPQKTSAYISQEDLHIAEMTVREILDFSAQCQGVGSRADVMMEISKREKEAGIVPDPDIDTYMKATSVEGLNRTLQTDYVLKILGLDVCADTMVGDVMRRGISGGQKKRLTTAEMIVGPTNVLLMDEISNGLDSSTTYQIVACLQQMVHIIDATALISLLQPAPETFELFDDIILMAEGKIVYQGPRNQIVKFFEDCGFRCPERKGVADFLQEVISRKDQAQYWYRTEVPYNYVAVDMFCRKFKKSSLGKKLREDLSVPFDKLKNHKDALSFDMYSVSNWKLFKACMSREFLLMKRNSFIYAFKTIQIIVIATIAMTVFIRTRMGIDVIHASYYMGALFFGLLILLVDGVPELTLTTARLPVFFKQKELRFYPAWAYAIPTAILKVPLSVIESVVWTCLTYYVIGYTPEASRFFRHLIILFAVHLASVSLFRCLASICQTVTAAMTAGGFGVLFVLIFGGFIIKHPSMPLWLKWGFWVSPLTYGEIGLSGNEFLAPRWQKMLSTNVTIGTEILNSRGLNYEGYYFWISLGSLFGFTLFFNTIFVVALSFLKPPGSSRAMISQEKYLFPLTMSDFSSIFSGKMVLPFQPLTLTFENMSYFVDTPLEMREHGFADNKVQLLSDVTGALRPGVLTALMGVSGAGKTTLLDVLAGRKTTGYIEGEIKIGGYPKVQETFARISGYCEQTDIHSPQITVGESLMFSTWLRLSPQIDSKTKTAFVNEVLEIIELDEIKDSLVGLPGNSGLSTEQRKRLTIAVELVANPSIIFMDEPTTGLDARAAAIVMRVVKNVVETGRTIVCTIHQPSIDIFEAFDELILLKRGGHVVYSGELGKHSSKLIDYFQSISGVPKIKDNYNPATWILELTSASAEAELGVDFTKIYKDSVLNEKNKELVRESSTPLPDSRDLHFPTRFTQDFWGQFKNCLWKQYWSYWRSPSYNLRRIMHVVIAAFLFGALFWNRGRNMDDQQSLFNIFGAFYVAVIFLGINNCSTVIPYVSIERTVMYREKFAGMYSPWAYAFAQVAVEIPYIFVEAFVFIIITYPMMGFYWSAYKIFWYLYAFFMTMLYFNYLGMLLVALTPNELVAAILTSVFYTLFNLFSGYIMPQPHIPKWWVWLYYLIPSSWTLNALITSQYGDISQEINAFGKTTSLSSFIKDYFGFHHDRLAATGVVLLLYPVIFASLFAYLIGRLNFLRR
ncbi:pleiotropic drug resistance protein 3-like isoform X2 [Mangifera indica]|uniref:pleiotropic drug resistance protein 3-like isoform X2 n=1 Tax=Mangifera indica TaxID=29780 RepID=UPI001CFBF571|nr:pleiotropic drug resistance protein 3-like isoform X2 [Mangifera indica]